MKSNNRCDRYRCTLTYISKYNNVKRYTCIFQYLHLLECILFTSSRQPLSNGRRLLISEEWPFITLLCLSANWDNSEWRFTTVMAVRHLIEPTHLWPAWCQRRNRYSHSYINQFRHSLSDVKQSSLVFTHFIS